MHDPRSVSKVAGNTEQGSASDLFQPLEKKNRKISKEYGVRICLVMIKGSQIVYKRRADQKLSRTPSIVSKY